MGPQLLHIIINHGSISYLTKSESSCSCLLYDEQQARQERIYRRHCTGLLNSPRKCVVHAMDNIVFIEKCSRPCEIGNDCVACYSKGMYIS